MRSFGAPTSEKTNEKASGANSPMRSPSAVRSGEMQTGLAPSNQVHLRRLAQTAPRVQTKLRVGAVNGPLEAEADQVATQIMSMPVPAAPPPGEPPPTGGRHSNSPQLSRKLAKSEEEDDWERAGELRRQPATSASASTASAGVAPPMVDRVLRSSGQPLDPATRSFFEPRFALDLSGVRVHADALAAQSAEAVNANAYTVGSDIVFGAGQYRPESHAGRQLLAHELTHTLQQGQGAPTRLSRQLKGEVTPGEPEINPADAEQKDEWVRLEVYASGMDDAARVLAEANPVFRNQEKRNNVYIGLHPKFIKVYDSTGKPLGARINLKPLTGLAFSPGVYVQGPQGGLVALTISGDKQSFGAETGNSVVGQRPFTDEEKAAMAEEEKKAKAEGREPNPPAMASVDFADQITELDRYRSMVGSVPNALAIYFVPTYTATDPKPVYSSPIEGRDDGKAANAPAWPVTVDGPKIVPSASTPTYAAKVDWTANGNDSLAAQVISQIGENIHYRWELFDITRYARKEFARNAAESKGPSGAKPEKSLDQRVEDFKNSKQGTGADVTGMGGANAEFNREFDDWSKDTKRAAKGTNAPGGDTAGERLSNAEANLLSLELTPVTLLTTSVGAALRWSADLFAGPRQQQEIPLKTEGVYLIRTITTPAIQDDNKGQPVIRPPSVGVKATAVQPIDKVVESALDEPAKQIDLLTVQIAEAELSGDKPKADYLRKLKADAEKRSEGSPYDLLVEQRDQKQKELDQFRKDSPTLSDYSRAREVDRLNDQIALYEHHEQTRTSGATDLPASKRVNATLISEVTGQQYPLLLSAGPMAMVGTQYQWMISDVTNRDADAFIGLGDTPSAALLSALTKFGEKAAYGRGRIGLTTAGLGLEAGAKPEFLVDSQPADWALAEKRIDDLVTTLALLGLVVASAGTAGAVIGGAVAAARLIQRWQAGRLYLDAQTVGDMLGVLGGVGASLQLAGGLRVQKFEKAFALVQEGSIAEPQVAAAAEALKGAQNLAKAVDAANEAILYGGLIWGNVSLIDQMISINAQESSGAMTKAEARRARAGAISSAVQNNGLFIAANVIKAKKAGAAERGETPHGTEAAPAKAENAAGPEKAVAPEEKAGAENKGTQDETTTAHQPEPLPLSERQATLAELQAALPPDLRALVSIDPTLHGETVLVEYTLDSATGLISQISLRCGPDARPSAVRIHIETVRTMQKYQGFSGRVRQAISWIADLVGVDTLSPEKNPAAFEATLEIRKLPKLIRDQMEQMRTLQPDARDLAEAQLEYLRNQLDTHMRTLDLGQIGEGEGAVAGKGLSKAKQKQYAALLAELHGFEPGTDSHKSKRWEMYQLVGGDLPYATWEKIYAANVERANIANASVAAEQARLGWGKTEVTISVGKNEIRRLDIADKAAQRGVEVKEYGTHYITASEDIVWELERDAKLVKRRWDITWMLIDTNPSGPLLARLRSANIKVEMRTRQGGGESKLLETVNPVAQTAAGSANR